MTKKILIAEDDKSMRNCYDTILGFYLKEYELMFAENGQIAIDIYKKEGKDIVVFLTDGNMPVKNGLEAAFEIKEEAKRNGRSIPTIMITSEGGYISGFKERLPQIISRIDYLVEKPFKSNDYVIATVQEAIQSRENKK